ncbi:MAG: hypothetical protein ACXQTP_02405 [Candidatus Methanofastidiosia archaeon]
MARNLGRRILVFLVVYLIVSTAVAYFFREDNLISIGETVEYEGEKVKIKVFYTEENAEWAASTLELVKNNVETLSTGLGKKFPHDAINIYQSTMEKEKNYPFSLKQSSNDIMVAVDYDFNPTLWGITQMWFKKGNVSLPQWIIWGESLFYNYWALNETGAKEDAEKIKTFILLNGESLEETFSLDSYDLPKNALDEKEKVDYFFAQSFIVFENLYNATSPDTLANINGKVLSSQNPEWDSIRYISEVQDATEGNVASIFYTVLGEDIEREIFKWKIIHYLEILGAIIVVVLIFCFAFWNKVRKRFAFIAKLKERNPIKKELIKRFGSMENVRIELETYFRKQIPDEKFDSFLNRYYHEKYVKERE